MKTIIAQIDFSEASINAHSFAAEVAKRSSAHLLVVHFSEETKEEADLKTKLEDIVFKFKKSFGTGSNCESFMVRGTLISTLKEMTETYRPSLVVMGTKGASGLKRILIGSNTVNFIAKTKVPVLVIPEVARFENFLRKGRNRVILATDLSDLKNGSALDILKEIALLIIEPKIRVLNVRPKDTHLDHVTRMERNALLSVFQPEIESEPVTVFSSNIMSGINFYLNKNEDTGLVAMIARDSGHLIQKHYTQEMASHTQFPLLVLHD
jgi:nucleotide-binding universal stress UspA family protein